jgi:hypothetical protein
MTGQRFQNMYDVPVFVVFLTRQHINIEDLCGQYREVSGSHFSLEKSPVREWRNISLPFVFSIACRGKSKYFVLLSDSEHTRTSIQHRR